MPGPRYNAFMPPSVRSNVSRNTATNPPMQALRAAYNQAHGVGRLRGGGGGAKDHADAMARMRLMRQGFTGAALEDALHRQGRSGQAYGKTAGDRDVLRWAMGQGYSMPGVAGALSQVQNAVRTSTSASPDPLKRLSREFQRAHNEAQLANELRFREAQGLLAESYDTNTGILRDQLKNLPELLDSQGRTDRALAQEQAEEGLGNIKAELQRRGLTNSTILPAFMARNQRDLGLIEGDIEERNDRVKLQYQTALANQLANMDRAIRNDQVALLASKHDNAPRMQDFAAMAQALGLANDGQGFDTGRRGGGVPQFSGGGVSGQAAAGMAAGMTGGMLGQINSGMNFLGGLLGNHGATPYNYTPRASQSVLPAATATGVATGGLSDLFAAAQGDNQNGMTAQQKRQQREAQRSADLIRRRQAGEVLPSQVGSLLPIQREASEQAALEAAYNQMEDRTRFQAESMRANSEDLNWSRPSTGWTPGRPRPPVPAPDALRLPIPPQPSVGVPIRNFDESWVGQYGDMVAAERARAAAAVRNQADVARRNKFFNQMNVMRQMHQPRTRQFDTWPQSFGQQGFGG